MSAEAQRPDDFDKLPKRFRDYVQKLESRVQAMAQLLDAPQSEVSVESYHLGVPTRYLQASARINFQLSSGAKLQVYLDTRRGTDTLQIYSSDGRLLLYPEISNEIGVKVDVR